MSTLHGGSKHILYKFAGRARKRHIPVYKLQAVTGKQAGKGECGLSEDAAMVGPGHQREGEGEGGWRGGE